MDGRGFSGDGESRYALAHNYRRLVAQEEKREKKKREDVKSLKRLESGRSRNRKTFACGGNDGFQRHFKQTGKAV